MCICIHISLHSLPHKGPLFTAVPLFHSVCPSEATNPEHKAAKNFKFSENVPPPTCQWQQKSKQSQDRSSKFLNRQHTSTDRKSTVTMMTNFRIATEVFSYAPIQLISCLGFSMYNT